MTDESGGVHNQGLTGDTVSPAAETMLGSASANRQFLRLLPSILVSTSMPIALSISDTVIVGKFSSSALAVIAFGTSVYSVPIMVAQSIALAHQVVAARLLGRGKIAGALLTFRFSMVLATLCACVFFVALAFGSPAISGMVFSDTSIAAEAAKWVTVRSIGIIPASLMMVLCAHLQAFYKTRPVAISGVLAVCINVLASAFLVYGAGQIEGMGLPGSAAGSVLAEVFGIVVLCALSKTRLWRLGRLGRKFVPSNYFEILLAEAGSLIALSSSEVLFIALVGQLGATALGAVHLGIVLLELVTTASIALAMGVQLVESRSSAGGEEQSFGLRWHFAILSIFVAVGIAVSASSRILARMLSVGAVADLSVVSVTFAGLSFPLVWMSCVTAARLRARGLSGAVFKANVISCWIVQVPCAWLSVTYSNFGIYGPLAAYTLYYVSRVVIQWSALVATRSSASVGQ